MPGEPWTNHPCPSSSTLSPREPAAATGTGYLNTNHDTSRGGTGLSARHDPQLSLSVQVQSSDCRPSMPALVTARWAGNCAPPPFPAALLFDSFLLLCLLRV
jgi:hypothetical protein